MFNHHINKLITKLFEIINVIIRNVRQIHKNYNNCNGKRKLGLGNCIKRKAMLTFGRHCNIMHDLEDIHD